ncbi:MAG: hypothetical protein SHS37scaffold145_18 [Phage 71_18]|nr:MAG: hypothetical protein SHS37scaffold145_18 [Phage 71_18]
MGSGLSPAVSWLLILSLLGLVAAIGNAKYRADQRRYRHQLFLLDPSDPEGRLDARAQRRADRRFAQQHRAW